MKQLILSLAVLTLCVSLMAVDMPENLNITREGFIIHLSWNAVPGADFYNIYRSSDPCSADWGYPVAQVSMPFYSESVSADKVFYHIRTVEASGWQNVFIPGGTFIMGRTTGNGDDDELPIHSVTLNPYHIGKYEVTQAEYASIMGTNPASGNGVGDSYPVYYVSWYAAIKYCNLRSLAEGLMPVYEISGSTDPATWGTVPTSSNATWNAAVCNWNASGYRLPTEAEWEYAARGAATIPDYLYTGSDNINTVAWWYSNSGGNAHPVGTKASNGIGSYDMSGNVWEWCWDWYSSTYYSVSPSDNPTGPASGSNRSTSGGAFTSGEHHCRVANRSSTGPSSSNNNLGFRLCRSAL